MFFDPLYILILVVTGALAAFAQFKVKRTFSKWSKFSTASRLTGAEVAREILRQEGVFDVKVERVGGFLSDHYDPRNKTLRLSPEVHDSHSVAAAGVAGQCMKCAACPAAGWCRVLVVGHSTKRKTGWNNGTTRRSHTTPHPPAPLPR